MNKMLLLTLSFLSIGSQIFAQQRVATGGQVGTKGAVGYQVGSKGGVGYEAGSQGGIGYEAGSQGGAGYQTTGNRVKTSACANVMCTYDMCADGKPRSEYNGNCCSCDPRRLTQ